MIEFLPLAAAGLSSLLNFEGTKQTNAANLENSQASRDWQERMSNTAHQREVADLQAAGLNPILSVSRGGAGTPTPTLPSMQNPWASATASAFDAYKTGAEVDLKRQEIRNRKQDERIKEPVAKIADEADQGVPVIKGAVQGAVESAIATALPAAEKLIESVSGASAASVSKVKEVAKRGADVIAPAVANTKKFVGGVVNSAHTARQAMFEGMTQGEWMNRVGKELSPREKRDAHRPGGRLSVPKYIRGPNYDWRD